MGNRFHEIAFTDLVKAHQQEHGSRRQYERMAQGGVTGGSLSISEETFLSMRDSFYMASVSETGWPYIQHRGGTAGFVKILAPDLIGFADLRGNKQYISLGKPGARRACSPVFHGLPKPDATEGPRPRRDSRERLQISHAHRAPPHR